MGGALGVALIAGCSEDEKHSSPGGEGPAAGKVEDAATASSQSDASPRLVGISVHGRAPRRTSQVEIVGDSIWVSDGTIAIRYPLDGNDGNSVRLGGVGGEHVALWPDGVYSIQPANGVIQRHDPVSGAAEKVGQSPTLATPAGIYRAADELVWATKKGLYRMARSGGKPRLVSKVWARGPLAVAGDEIILSNGAEIVAVSLKRGRERALAKESARIAALEVADKRVYWRAGGRVASVPVAGGDVIEHTTQAGDNGWLAAGRGHVYWLESPGAVTAAIRRCTSAGTTIEVVLQGPIGPGAATVGEQRLYFASTWKGEGTLLSRQVADTPGE